MTCAPSTPAGLARRGFTLVELLAVIAILGVIGYLVVPMFGRPEIERLKAAAQLIEADIAAAQVDSITHTDDPRLIVFDLDAAAYHVAASSSPTVPLTEPVTKAPYRVQMGAGRASACGGVTISNLSVGGDAQLGFGPYGQLDETSPASITLSSGPHTLTLTIDAATGAVTIGQVN